LSLHFFVIISFLGLALDFAGHLVSIWAHVNLPYRIVSCMLFCRSLPSVWYCAICAHWSYIYIR